MSLFSLYSDAFLPSTITKKIDLNGRKTQQQQEKSSSLRILCESLLGVMTYGHRCASFCVQYISTLFMDEMFKKKDSKRKMDSFEYLNYTVRDEITSLLI